MVETITDKLTNRNEDSGHQDLETQMRLGRLSVQRSKLGESQPSLADKLAGARVQGSKPTIYVVAAQRRALGTLRMRLLVDDDFCWYRH